MAHADLDATGLPVLVITGTDDTLFPAPPCHRHGRTACQRAVVEIADAGHSPYFERPDLYNEAVLAFLEESGTMSEVVTAEQIEALQTDGFVVVDDLLTDAELDTFEPLVTAAVAYRSAGDERTLEERPTGRSAVQRRRLETPLRGTSEIPEDPPAIMPGDGGLTGTVVRWPECWSGTPDARPTPRISPPSATL